MSDAPQAPAVNAFASADMDRLALEQAKYAASIAGDRVSKSAAFHNRLRKGRGGCFKCDNGITYYDADAVAGLEQFGRDLEGRPTSDLGELADWFIRLSVRPHANSGPLRIASYAFRSAFVNVSDVHNQDPILNQFVNEFIKVCEELFIDLISIRADNVDPEQALKQGFNEANNAIHNLRKNKISSEVINAVDNYFDTAVEAIEDALTKGIIKGGTLDALPEYCETFGKHLANELKKYPDKQKLVKDPVAVFDFYNQILTNGNMGFRLPEDQTIKALRQARTRIEEIDKAGNDFQARIAALEKENEALKTEAGRTATGTNAVRAAANQPQRTQAI